MTRTWYCAASLCTVSIWWLLPSMTAIHGLTCPGSRRSASANASAITSAAGLAADANRVLPCAFGPGSGFGDFVPGRAGPNSAATMSRAVRGAGGMSATAASSAVRFFDFRSSPGSSGHPSASFAFARVAAAFAVAGRSADGSTGNADPSQVSSTAQSAGQGSGRREA